MQTVRSCQHCGKTLRSDQTKSCSKRCQFGGEFRMEYLQRMLLTATRDKCLIWPYGKTKFGYGVVGTGGESSQLVHRIALASVMPLAEDECALHHCDQPACYCPYHLFKGSRADNNLDRKNKGRGTKGMTVHWCKLTPEQVSDIRARWKPHFNAGELAREYGVTTVQIRLIGSGLSQVETGTAAKPYKKNAKRLNAAAVADIRKRWILQAKGERTMASSNHELAHEYGIPMSTAYSIATHRSYKGGCRNRSHGTQ